MARIITDAAGIAWEVTPSGRRTQYGSDEVSLEFQRVGDGAPERRFSRFAPRGAKAVEMALEDTSDAALVVLLGVSQPAWTSPDGSYGRPS